MDKRFLLTYLSIKGIFEYRWFETDEVQDCIEIKESRDVDY